MMHGAAESCRHGQVLNSHLAAYDTEKTVSEAPTFIELNLTCHGYGTSNCRAALY